MNNLIAFRIVQGFYWLGLGIWLGALVMLAIMAAVTFRTVRELKPSINAPPYNNPALAERAPVIIAGNIVGNSLRALAVLQLICAVMVVMCLILQCSLFADQLRGGVGGWVNLLRVALVVMPIFILALDANVITPRIWAQRTVMFDVSQAVEVRARAQAVFDRLHKLDERVVGASVWLLMGAVFVSAFAFEVGKRG